MPDALHCGRFTLSLQRPLVMGVVNVTPDSFSDGGLTAESSRAIDHALRLFGEGADLVDIGAESTRPGARPVPAGVEAARVLPVIEALRSVGKPLSVDTAKPEVMRLAIDAGADMINDVNAFLAEGAFDVVGSTAVALCIMHKKGDPATMQADPRYVDVVREVHDFLAARVLAAEHAGVARNRIVVDPGFGFGKTLQHNLRLFAELGAFGALGLPLLVGMSRKSMLGAITGRAVSERIHASVAAALLAACRGARILRVHDVRATVDALAVYTALKESARQGVEDT